MKVKGQQREGKEEEIDGSMLEAKRRAKLVHLQRRYNTCSGIFEE